MLSVALFGLLVLVARPEQAALATYASLAAIAVFVACHRPAHASEATGAVPAFLAGFLISTAALHLVGIGAVRQVSRGTAARMMQRVTGALIAAFSLFMLIPVA